MLTVAGFAPPGFAGQVPEPSGEEVVRRVNDLMTPMTSKGIMTQTIQTTSGKRRVFQFEMFSANRGEKTLMRYIKPASVKNQAFLMLNNADDIWAYFPRTNRVRKLASHAKKQKVLGSDFTYEDIGSGEVWVDQFIATNLGEESLLGERCWKLRLDGKPEERPSYQKMIMWVRQSDDYPLQIDYYDGKSDLIKSLFLEDIRIVEGIPTAMRMVMKNRKDDTETVMETLSVTYGWEPPRDFFSERNLKR
ncbi:MAG: outer membrane lipoprotein-sorting protein [Fidelibacterota bacterium]